MSKIFAALAVVLTVGLMSFPAAADWHGHHGGSRFIFSFGFGPVFPPYYYYPHYYPYPAPVYYAPPPVYYAPAPVYVPAPQYVPQYAPQAQAAPYCREFHGDATIDSNQQPFYGRACLQPDGQWHIVP